MKLIQTLQLSPHFRILSWCPARIVKSRRICLRILTPPPRAPTEPEIQCHSHLLWRLLLLLLPPQGYTEQGSQRFSKTARGSQAPTHAVATRLAHHCDPTLAECADAIARTITLYNVTATNVIHHTRRSEQTDYKNCKHSSQASLSLKPVFKSDVNGARWLNGRSIMQGLHSTCRAATTARRRQSANSAALA